MYEILLILMTLIVGVYFKICKTEFGLKTVQRDMSNVLKKGVANGT